MPWHTSYYHRTFSIAISHHIIMDTLFYRYCFPSKSLCFKKVCQIYTFFIMYPTLSFRSSFSNSITLSSLCFWHYSTLYLSKWSHSLLLQSYPIHHASYFILQPLFTIRYLHWDLLVYICNYDKPSMSRLFFLTLLHLSSSNQCIQSNDIGKLSMCLFLLFPAPNLLFSNLPFLLLLLVICLSYDLSSKQCQVWFTRIQQPLPSGETRPFPPGESPPSSLFLPSPRGLLLQQCSWPIQLFL